ncbi:CARD- and ANK-domain containing inflammasome adapter protein-like [Anomaloglossus baeobatrachus]|uniref:CARD- and ANK-domain containing inflammasome adapter protein-like n=1 Tax=Anomaloglossus baeobatrachus TaxID=238106 RepID=UPI003F4FE6C2
MSAASSVLFPPISPQEQFTNPYAIDVLKTKKDELIEGIKNPEELINLLVEHGIFSKDKKMVMSYYRTRTEKNSRLVDILLSKGERACRLFFYPCLKQIEPGLYNSVKRYVNHVNDSVKDGRRQLVGYLLERDKEDNQAPVIEPPEKNSRKENLPKKVKKEPPKPSVQVKEKKRPKPETPRQKVVQSSDGVFDAVMKGDLSLLESILKGSDVNAVNSSGETLLHVAASNGHVPVIEFLLSKGAKVDAKDKKRRTPLHRAAENGHLEAAKVLLRAGANIYSLDNDSQSPLHLAAQNNHHHLIKLFLQEEGKRYKNRSNFLHLEAAKDNSRLVEILLKNGANVDSMDEKKQTALYHAVSGGHEATVKVLLEAGANIDPSIIDVAFNTNNEYIFGLLLQYSKGLSPDTMISAMFKAVKLNLFGIIKALIDKGTDVNARNDIEYTPLLLAAELGKPEAAQALIEKGAHIEDRTPNLSTALHLSVQGGDVAIMELLLRKGINVNITGPGDQTPLHVAAYHDRPDLCEMLLSAGASVNVATKEGMAPLHLASQRNNVDVAQNLIEHKANVNAKDKQLRTPLHMAAEGGGLALVQLLLNNKADPNISDKEKKTPLHIAAAGGNAEVVAALLSSQARYGAKDMDGCTPIHYASISGNMDIVKSLLKAGKNKNLEDKNVWRKTPLHLAAEHGHSDIIQLLLTNGAAIDPLDNNRDTPLHGACKSGHLSSVQTLVGWTQGHKANLQATNSLKKTPLQVAEAGTTDSHQQVATLLKKKMFIIK